MIKVGLTGPTGAGKSQVVSYLQKSGYAILDADAIYHSLLENSSTLKDNLINRFGRIILTNDGRINRKVLGNIVFSDKQALEDLNHISHPLVIEQFLLLSKKYELENKKIVFFDAPQLFEAKADQYCDYIISVLAPIQTRIERIMKRDRISKEDVLKRMHSQYEDTFFCEHSHFIIQNDDSLENLQVQIQNILKKII